MNSYPSYKDSGVEWIGEIPSSWSVKRNKYITTPKKDKSEDGSEELLSVSEYLGVVPRSVIREGEDHLTRSESLEGYLKVSKGDLVNNIMLMWKKGLGVSKYDGIVSPSYSVFSFNESIPTYHHYLFRTDLYITEFRKNSTGIIQSRLRLYDDDFGFIYSYLPPIDEQKQIVSFLDTKTQKIDELIEKTEQKIELLKEKRTSLINHCVTKGLNPDVEMKDSGVEWIGEIPNHWGVKLLKFVFNSIREKSETGEEELLSVLIKKGVVRRRDFLGEDSDNLTRSESLVGYIHCSKGNLVNNIMKMGFYCLGISDYDGIVSPGYSVFEMIDNNDYPKYWDYLLKTEIYVSEYRKRSKGIQESRMRLYDDYFLSIHSLYPPKTEQTKIIEHLDEQTQKIDSTIEKETQRIELLKEYRQSLISEVVTGKVDVREWSG